jgi:hypothetical protein
MSVTFPSNVLWALSSNQQAHLTSDLQQKYPEQTYWNSVDQLISRLRAAGCSGIQDKMADVSDSRKILCETCTTKIENDLKQSKHNLTGQVRHCEWLPTAQLLH